MRALPFDDVAIAAGAVLVVAGCFLLAVWLGFVIAGVALIAAGIFLGGESS